MDEDDLRRGRNRSCSNGTKARRSDRGLPCKRWHLNVWRERNATLTAGVRADLVLSMAQAAGAQGSVLGPSAG